VLLGAASVLKRNEHVRVDIFYGRLRGRAPVLVDLFGLLLFLLPITGLLLWQSWPLFARAWATGEMSGNTGGLIRWPVMLLLPLGFALLWLQGAAEVIKRIAHLRGAIQLDTHYEKPVQ
jgi:TRAP-type mannitol/chloroaromatic compound transport system permease small subunit